MSAGSAAGRMRATPQPGIGGCALPGPLIAEVTGSRYAAAVTRLVLERLGMSGSSFSPRLANLRSAVVTGYSLTSKGTFVRYPARVYTMPAGGPWLFLARARRSWARISGTVLFCIATVAGLGTLLAPEAVVTKVFRAVFWLIGLGAVVLLWRRSATAFGKGARP